MLMGTGLLSKFVELVASKLIGKRLDLAMDEKRRACHTLVELYSILLGFSSIASKMVVELEESEFDSVTPISLIYVNHKSIQAQTVRFFDLGDDLSLTLGVVDPALAAVFDQIHHFKASVFYALSESISIPEDGPRNQSIAYRHPSDRLLEIDMNAYYQTLEAFRNDYWQAPSIWPDDILMSPEYSVAFTSVRFATDDKQQLIAFTDDLKLQLESLNRAAEHLRVLIKDNFTLDEVLTGSKRVPRGS
jgi:hypothetical protein